MKITKIGQPSELARTFLQKLEESTALASQSSQTSELEVCLVNYSDSISTEDQRTIEDIIDRGLSILFLENAKEEYFPKNSLFATDSEVCIIKSDAQGRRQHMLMLGTKEQPTFIPAARENDAATMEASEEAKEKKTKETRSEEKSTTETGQDKPAIVMKIGMSRRPFVTTSAVQQPLMAINTHPLRFEFQHEIIFI